MRKILFVLTLSILFSGLLQVQSTRLGITAGATYATQFTKINGEKDLGDYKIGATFGVMLDVPMQKHGSFRAGLNFTQKGTGEEYMDGQDKVKLTRRINYLEAPLLVMFNIPCKSSNSFRLGAGPAAGIALSGKDKIEVNGSEDEEDINFGDKTDSDMNWVDFTINVQAEYEMSGGFTIAAGYSHGINRLFVGGNEKDKLYNRYFSLRFGYFFGGKKK